MGFKVNVATETVILRGPGDWSLWMYLIEIQGADLWPLIDPNVDHSKDPAFPPKERRTGALGLLSARPSRDSCDCLILFYHPCRKASGHGAVASREEDCPAASGRRLEVPQTPVQAVGEGHQAHPGPRHSYPQNG